MKLASLPNGTPDGAPVLVSNNLQQAVALDSLAKNTLDIIERWQELSPKLAQLSNQLNSGELANAFAFDATNALAPLPRTWQWLDGSVFLNHGELMQKAFHLEPIADVEKYPLMYQGGSDDFTGPCANISCPDESLGLDFEGEFAVIVDEVPLGVSVGEAAKHIVLVVLLNDISLRALAPREMKTGFGFVQAKPTCSFSPVAITPDELNGAWQNNKVNLPLNVEWNGQWFGNPNGSEMHFNFAELIAHAAKTRRLSAGTIIGSGTVSSYDRSQGSACISERRALDVIEFGEIKTPFLKHGDQVLISATDASGNQPFGEINQRVHIDSAANNNK